MITFAPSPSWKSLFKLLFVNKVDETRLDAVWKQDSSHVIWFSRTAWALHAIARWWEKNFSKKPIVWVPGYFCNQSLWPLRQTGVKIVFYPIQEQMLPHWESCKQLAEQNKPDIFIVTHFYGFITPTEKIEKFCNQYNALLVEDAAHILVPAGDVGRRGHFILYSPYKLFSLSHGAACVIRHTVKDYMNNNGIQERIALQDVSLQVGTHSPPIAKWFIKKVIQKIIGDRFDFVRKKVPFEEDGTSDPMPYTPQMHPIMKKLLYITLDQIPNYILHRRNCAILWEYLFAQNDIAVQRLTFSSEETPYIAVFRSLHNEASKIYYKFKNWPLSSWPDLPPEVKQDPVLHKTTIDFRNNMLVVPTHQTLSFCELSNRFHRIAEHEYYRLEKIDDISLLAKDENIQEWVATIKFSDGLINHYYLIYNKENPIGLICVQSKKIRGLLKLVFMAHHPLFFDRRINYDFLYATYALLRQVYKGNIFLIASEVENNIIHQAILFQTGYRKLRAGKINGKIIKHSVWI